jgi:xanthine dehydrogenase accessory factor
MKLYRGAVFWDANCPMVESAFVMTQMSGPQPDPTLPEWPDYGLLEDMRGPLFAALGKGQAVVLATLFRVEGGGPRPEGTQMVFTQPPEGPLEVHGFMSGGCVEADVARHAMAVIVSGAPMRLVYGPSSPWPDIRLLCGAEIEILLERIAPGDDASDRLQKAYLARQSGVWISDGTTRRFDLGAASRACHWTSEPFSLGRSFDPIARLIVVGSDPTALAIASLGVTAGFQTWLNRPKGPASAPPVPSLGYLRQDPQSALNQVGLDPWTYVAIASHDAETDHPALVTALKSSAAYVGLLGARRRLPERLAALKAAGVSDEAIAQLHAPIGMDLGGKAPWEVAISVLGEMIQTRQTRMTQSRMTKTSKPD